MSHQMSDGKPQPKFK